MTIHQWVVGHRPGSDGPGETEVSCHRRLRGPYTGLGNLLRAVVPEAHRRSPDLVGQHVIAILSAAPELTDLVGAAPETLTSLAVPAERTRIYPANRTRRLAHSAVEFLEAYAELADVPPLTLVFQDVDLADNTDQEFLSILVRRARSGRIRVVVVTRGEQVTDELAAALGRYADRVEAAPRTYPVDGRDQDALLRAYLESDGTSGDPAELAAYENADPKVRAALHTARAEELTARDERSLHLGAIPYHHEHGVDPTSAGLDALMAAADYGAAMGFYHAILDYGRRGRKTADPEVHTWPYFFLSTKASTALSLMGRTSESEPIYVEVRGRYCEARLHVTTGYALAMVYTRFRPPERRDHLLARSYINGAIVIAEQLPDPEDRIFQVAFVRNGRALIEMHLGNVDEALRLVNEGMSQLHEKLPPDRHRLHRSVLVHNRGRVLAALGRREEALADFDTVLELDPNYPDYYFDRADLRRQLGDLPGALADYNHAMTLTAPFHELHYNRADLLAELGDQAGAIADLSYVVELEPDQLDARVNLIGLLLDDGATDRAESYVDEGLVLHSGDARLLHARGLVALERGDRAAALADFDLALAADPHLVPALAGRATMAYEDGDHDAALTDLGTALDVDAGNPDLLYNRGFVYQSAGRWDDAVRDYSAALAQPHADRQELLNQRALCYAKLGDGGAHDADLSELALAGKPA
jgi:tetratricopeptide (TPR) repeat protein